MRTIRVMYTVLFGHSNIPSRKKKELSQSPKGRLWQNQGWPQSMGSQWRGLSISMPPPEESCACCVFENAILFVNHHRATHSSLFLCLSGKSTGFGSRQALRLTVRSLVYPLCCPGVVFTH